MYLAVKLAKNTQNLDQMPPEWPAQVREIHHGEEVPTGFVAMTRQEYAEYCDRYRHEYSRWDKMVREPGEMARKKAEKAMDNLLPLVQVYQDMLDAGEELTPQEQRIIDRYEKLSNQEKARNA